MPMSAARPTTALRPPGLVARMALGMSMPVARYTSHEPTNPAASSRPVVTVMSGSMDLISSKMDEVSMLPTMIPMPI